MTTATAATIAHTDAEPSQDAGAPVKRRIAFVSGGMGGIGTAVCRRLSRNGAKVVAGRLPRYDREDDWRAGGGGGGLEGVAAEGDLGDHRYCARKFFPIGLAVRP